jgi:hypothetical protein
MESVNTVDLVNCKVNGGERGSLIILPRPDAEVTVDTDASTLAAMGH